MKSRSSCSSGWVVVSLLIACRPTAAPQTALQIVAPAEDLDADVYVDGNYLGQLSALRGAAAPKLAPGRHRVEVRKPGRFPVQRTIDVARTGPAAITLDAELLEDPS